MSSNTLVPFAFNDSLVRVLTDENGDPWFVAKDVCRVLDIEWKGSGTLGPLDEDERGSVILNTPGGTQQMLTISESGLYALIFRSRKPEARRFRKWVTAEVLPAIRRTGRYGSETCGALPPMEPPHSVPLPEEAKHLRPGLREKLWQDALQTARLDNAGAEAAMHWFGALCRMVTDKPPSHFEEVRDFVEECCVIGHDGDREKASDLYKAFCRWRGQGKGYPPSMKNFGLALGRFARRIKNNTILYQGVSLKR